MSDDFNPNSVNAVLARMEQKQKDNGEKLDTAITRLSDIVQKHDDRLSDLEGSKKWLMGVCAAIGFFSPHASKWLFEKFSGQ